MRVRKLPHLIFLLIPLIGCSQKAGMGSDGPTSPSTAISGNQDPSPNGEHDNDEMGMDAPVAPWPPPVMVSWPEDQIAPWPTVAWSSSSPEEQGIDSQELIDLVEYADSTGAFQSILLIRNGYLVLEVYWPPYGADVLHGQFSITKSIVSSLIGIVYMDGLISGPDQEVVELFPDIDSQEWVEGVADMTIEQVLMMAAGLNTELALTRDILAGELKDTPGMSFEYNNAGPQLMVNAVQQITGMDPLAFAQERLFDPLGIAPENVIWAARATDLRDGGSGLELRPRDMAKIGYLFLHHGIWDGQIVLPSEWVAWSVYPHEVPEFDNRRIPSDGYGYFWWVNRQDGFYLAVGFGGQLIVVFPGKNMILVTTGNAQKSQGLAHYTTLTTFVVPLEIAEQPLPENLNATSELDSLIRQIGGQD